VSYRPVDRKSVCVNGTVAFPGRIGSARNIYGSRAYIGMNSDVEWAAREMWDCAEDIARAGVGIVQ
jgi:hypothetical protein